MDRSWRDQFDVVADTLYMCYTIKSTIVRSMYFLDLSCIHKSYSYSGILHRLMEKNTLTNSVFCFMERPSFLMGAS